MRVVFSIQYERSVYFAKGRTVPANKLKGKMVERHTLADQVHTSLKKAVLEGDLRPGERLKELEIAQSLGASRTPVREALSRLEQEGLVQPFPSGGLTVVELSTNDVEEIFGLLKVVESYACKLALENITEKQLEKIESICVRAEQLPGEENERRIDLNQRFHAMLIEVTGRRRLIEFVTNLRSAMQPYRIIAMNSSAFQGSPEFLDLMVRDHTEIAQALRARDEERLVRLVHAHNEVAKRSLIEFTWGKDREHS